MKRIVVYDVETFNNCFTVTFQENEKIDQFVIFAKRNDSQKIRDYLKGCDLMVGFNSLDFDYRIIEMILNKDCTASQLYKKAQSIIEEERSFYGKTLIPQLDLIRVHHYNNAGRMSSLKWLQINMGMEVMDSPFKHSDKITLDDIPEVLKYNLNDVLATTELYKRSTAQIEMRKALSERYNYDMSNFPDPKIGEYIVINMLSDRLKMSPTALRQCRTFRPNLKIKDCILPSVNFKTKEFNEVLDKFKQMVINDTRKTEDIVAAYDNVHYYFGIGGIHACRSNGVYTNIHSCDVSAFYPSLAVAQRFAPAQFGEGFVETYKQIIEERGMYPKGSAENIGLKLAGNGVFGKSNSEYSCLYDPMFFAKITINGQLLLAMLCERITLSGAGRVILANTDGIEVEVYDEPKYKWLCSQWEKKFGVNLEHTIYKTLAVRDINSYVAVGKKMKCKGAFETRFDAEEMVLHKDHSQQIVALAAREQLINGTPIEQTIRSCHDINMFTIGSRAKTGSFYIRHVKNSQLVEEPLPKHLRYYISKGGGALMKQEASGDKNVHKKSYVTLMNKFHEPPYNIDYQYYIREANKLVTSCLK